MTDHLVFTPNSPFLKDKRDLSNQLGQEISTSFKTKPQTNTFLAFTNISFETISEQINQKGQGTRLHSKKSIKKMGTINLIENKKHKTIKPIDIKRLSYVNLSSIIKQSSSRLRKAQNKKIHEDEEIVEIRTFDTINKQIHHAQQSHRISLINLIAQENTPQKYQNFRQNICQTEYFIEQSSDKSEKPIFTLKQLRQKFSGDDVTKVGQNKPSNQNKIKQNYYNKLKNRVKNEMNKIQDSKMNKVRQLTQGCQIIKYDKSFSQSRLATERPKSAISRIGLQFTFQNQKKIQIKRPHSSRSRKLQRQEILFQCNKIKENIANFGEENIKVKTTKSRNQSLKQKSNSRVMERSKTYNHIKSLSNQTNLNVDKKLLFYEKTKERMLNIILQCHKQQPLHNKLNRGITFFEQYNEKMSINLKNASRLLTQVQIDNNTA